MGISGKKMMSICFLLVVIFIALALGSLTFLINDKDARLPDVGLEGNKNMEEENKQMKEGNKQMKEGNKQMEEDE
tara:strand:+ start:417 stop:641 length:225 start_codon:yes stop_codon:yes gene_type:complete